MSEEGSFNAQASNNDILREEREILTTPVSNVVPPILSRQDENHNPAPSVKAPRSNPIDAASLGERHRHQEVTMGPSDAAAAAGAKQKVPVMKKKLIVNHKTHGNGQNDFVDGADHSETVTCNDVSSNAGGIGVLHKPKKASRTTPEPPSLTGERSALPTASGAP